MRAMPLIAICLGYFMVILDATVVNVALPALGRDLGGGVSGLQAAPAQRAGIASGVLNGSGQAGGAIGVALLGTLVGSGAFIPGLHVAMVVAGAVFFLAAGVAAATVETA